MLDMRRLHVLLTVARLGSLSAAAAEMTYSPSALSQQIKALERELGVRVLERGARGAHLTEAGELLLKHAEAAAAHLSAAEADLADLVGGHTGRLRMGWFSTAGAVFVPEAIEQFLRENPAITLEFVEADPDECIAMLRNGQLDIALLYRFDLEPALPTDIKPILLCDDPVHIAMPTGHPLATRDEIRLRDLIDERWIQGVRQGATAAVLPRACERAGFQPIVAFQTSDHLAVQGFVAAGIGIALIPAISVPALRPDIAAVPLAVADLTREISAALPPFRYHSPSATKMLTILQRIHQQPEPARPDNRQGLAK